MTVTTLMTADELLRAPDDGYRYELVRGELRKMSPSGLQHGDIAARIIASLFNHLEATGLGRVYATDPGFKIERNPDTVRVPDVGFLRRERVVDTQKFFEGAPDVAFEVISPTDTYTDVEEKTEEWLRGGARAVVVVNPRTKTVRVHRSGGAETLTDILAVEDVIPGWRMPVSKLFD